MIFNPVEIRTMIYVVTRRTGTPVHDEDLEQDVALRAVEAFHRIDIVAYPRALLMKIVNDSVRDYWRRRRSSEDLAAFENQLIAHAPALESQLDAERRAALLRHALEQLPVAKRSLLEMFYVRDHSIGEIAEMQERSISAVKMDLSRSRQQLARIIRRLANKNSRIAHISKTS